MLKLSEIGETIRERPPMSSIVPMSTQDSSTAGRVLRTGAVIPKVGIGTFGSDRYDAPQIAGAVRTALGLGYRLVDCASVYGNEREVGAILAEALATDVEREHLFVISKVWNDAHEPDRAIASVEQSVRDLQVEYLDAVFVHWPFANHHPPQADTDARDPNARPYDHAGYMATWRALESLVDRGLVRHLGTSNITIPKLSRLLGDARIYPSLNEMELHPSFQQGELFQYCLDHQIQPIGYSPLGSPSRPARDTSPDDVVDIDLPAVRQIAASRGIHPALVCLKWAVSRGQVPIPFSVKAGQLRSNLEAALYDPLTPAELDLMRSAERNSRLIKGQVFLWPGASSWLDLWDVDGTIPGWNGYGGAHE